MHNEAAVFNVPCFACSMMGETRMCEISVPYFTDLIIMSFRCEYCGAHSAETKGCGEVKENASIITLNVEGDADLKRDLFKVTFNRFRVIHVQSTFLTFSLS
jgi:C4-type Zn-finger protein